MAPRRVWWFRVLFALLAFLVLFFALLPFGPGEGGVPGPDLTLCLAAAWVLRRPDYVPVWLLIPLLVLGDALLGRPLGLWALIVLLITEYLRRRVDQSEALPFWSEVGLVTGCIAVAFVANYAALVLLLAGTPPLGGEALHALATIVFYPPAAIFSQMLGVRRLAPGELDTLGSRA
ncbi:rod shape-determining protein MreD [Jannaschia sp. W003]|uniref:rod shape-determining protein MreD n=1 Tax=Jannaschia sp. W003 TaxID=2867012 RepID=UPI0021A49637|nr:rod shape-determining protein MreD [Jannaschia sp. W003]UWQ22511.1 rod shape-determining protein MreD [Jannaschia sp. W003]